MKTSYFHVLLSVLILAFAGLGYWSYTSIDISFDGHQQSAQPAVITDSNTDMSVVNQETNPVPVSIPENITQPASQTEASTSTTVPEKKIPAKYTYLAGKLKGLIQDNIVMKSASKGTRVGTIQEFLNIYEGKKDPIVNLYGPITQSRVKAFQGATGDTPDGFADPVTYQKMIDWLKNSAQ